MSCPVFPVNSVYQWGNKNQSRSATKYEQEPFIRKGCNSCDYLSYEPILFNKRRIDSCKQRQFVKLFLLRTHVHS